MSRRRARRFLAPQARSGNGHGYLSQPQRELPDVADPPDVVERIAAATAMCDEPESVGPAVIDANTELARRYEALRHQAALEAARVSRPLLSAEDRIRDIEARAKNRHIDVSHETHIMRVDLERARRGRRREPERVLRRIERLEGELDHRPDLEDAA